MVVGAVAFLLAFVVSVLLTPAVRDLAHRLHLVDAVGSTRKVHKVPTPRVGGVAIFVAFYVGEAIVLLRDDALRAYLWAQGGLALAFLGGGVVIALVGLYDDVRGLRARHKLLLQLAVAGGLAAAGFVIEDIVLPTGTIIHLGLLGVPLTIFWMAAVMNAINLVDGLDGLAAGLSVLALATVFVFSVTLASPVLALQAVALAGAIAGFLVFNFNPASVFMGDTGSLFIGYCLSVVTVVAARAPATSAVEPWLPLLVLGVPIADTTLALLRRASRGRPLFSPDREHLHHRLLAMGMSQRRAVLTLYVTSGLLGLGAVVIRESSPAVAVVAVAVLLAAAGLGLWRLGLMRFRLASLSKARARNLTLRSRLHTSLSSVRRAKTLPALVRSAEDIGSVVGAQLAYLRVGSMALEGAAKTDPGPLSVRYLLRDGAVCVGALELRWTDRHHELDADEALAIEKICEELARATRRLRSAAPSERRRSAG